MQWSTIFEKTAKNQFFCCCTRGVTIPNTVIEIGTWAFAICEKLTSINIPCSVTYIGGLVFDRCPSLTNIVISEGVTKIFSWDTFSGAGCEKQIKRDYPHLFDDADDWVKDDGEGDENDYDGK